LKVRFWGTRGSIATPGAETNKYGGNTSCLEVSDGSERVFIFDAGTGIRKLGLDLARRKAKEIHLFISHTHWDHIQGFPFFTPAYIPGVNIHIYGPKHYEKTLRHIMDLQMDYAYFPISMQQLNAKISYSDLQETELQFGDTKILAKYANHPVTGLCYKVIHQGKSLVYSGDMEPFYNVLGDAPADDVLGAPDEDINEIVKERNQHHQEFCRSDLLIHDAQYTEKEYEKVRGWGHSPMEAVLRMAQEGGVKKTVLTHHDPDRTDAQLDQIETNLRTQFSSLDFVISQEGMELEV
jgi:phosphoribosyl 1,2-cyclic phosphodiesterase